MLTNRKQVILAAGGSLMLHVIFLLSWAFSVHWLPSPKPPAPTPPPIRLQIVKEEATPPPALEATPTPPPRPLLDTSSRSPADKPPDDAKFESNQDTRAASTLPASGDAALPSQEGKKTPKFNFDTTHYTPGNASDVAAAAPASAPPPPEPVASPARPMQTPAPTPTHTPVPDDEFGLPPPTPKPEDTEPPFDPTLRGPASTMPDRPTVASRSANASNAAGFQAEQEATSVSGAIGRRGENSVDSIATPVGRYKNRVVHAISAKWYGYFFARSDIVSLGMCRVHIVVDRGGRVLTPHVLSNSSNEALASISVQAIMDAPIPPMPPETLMVLKGGELSMDLTFNSE